MTARKNRCQFSLLTLFVIVTIAAVGAKLAGWIGYELLFGIVVLLAVFWLTYRLLYDMQKSGNRTDVSNGPPSPDY